VRIGYSDHSVLRKKPTLPLTARALPLPTPSGMIAATEIEAAGNAAG
jgi:hypothetical protein